MNAVRSDFKIDLITGFASVKLFRSNKFVQSSLNKHNIYIYSPLSLFVYIYIYIYIHIQDLMNAHIPIGFVHKFWYRRIQKPRKFGY